MKRTGLLTRDVEFRASSTESDGMTLEGYATVFDQDTEIKSWEGHFTERIVKGACRKTLRERKPVCQYNHGRDQRVGTVPIATYEELREDDEGLYVKGRVHDNEVTLPVRQAIAAGDIPGMSITMQVIRDEWRDNAGKIVRGDEIRRLLWEPGDRGPLQRTIKEIKLLEAGPVLYPAYTGTSVGMRSDDLTDEQRDEIADQYRRTMQEPEAEKVAAWLEAERTWNWLEAERTHLWLEAEHRWTSDDAARKGTSSTNPSDAAPEGTSRRDSENTTPPIERKKTMTLEELRARLAEIVARQSALGTEYRDKELPEEVQTEWDALKAERTEAEGRVAAIEARQEEVRQVAAAGQVERVGVQAPAVQIKPEDIYDLDALRRDSNGAEDYQERSADYAKRAIDDRKTRFSTITKREAAQETVTDLLERFEGERDDRRRTLAERILITGSPTYERAWSKALAAGNPNILAGDEFRALTLGTDGAAGYAVPFQLDPTVILTSAGVVDPLRSIARVEQIVGKEWQGVVSTGVTVSRDAEAAEVSDDSFALTQPVVRTNRVQGFVPFSYELESSWAQLRSEISRMLLDGKIREEASAFVTGDGSTGQQAGGIIGSLSGNTVDAASGQSFTAANIYSLEEALDPRWQANAKFLANKAIYNKVRQFDTAGGAALWVRIGAATPSQLIGYDALENSSMTGTTATGVKFLLFGDFQQFLIVDRIGMSVELIPQIFGASGRPTGQRGIYAIWMNNSKILVPGAFKVLIGKA
jgi:HK97 family phage major capsid protein/HK97 family phage prohead protease